MTGSVSQHRVPTGGLEKYTHARVCQTNETCQFPCASTPSLSVLLYTNNRSALGSTSLRSHATLRQLEHTRRGIITGGTTSRNSFVLDRTNNEHSGNFEQAYREIFLVFALATESHTVRACIHYAADERGEREIIGRKGDFFL